MVDQDCRCGHPAETHTKILTPGGDWFGDRKGCLRKVGTGFCACWEYEPVLEPLGAPGTVEEAAGW